MKEQLKHSLEKMPVLYRFIAKGDTYTALRFRYLKYLLSGTKVTEKEWATRHLREGERERDDWGKSDDWIKGYQDSENHPHRTFLVEIISKFNPSSILEVGCNCGPNLGLLAKKFPDAEIRGIDINPMAVQKGNEWLAQEGISNVKLLEGKADELRQFQDRSFDVVFTDAVLIYVGPDKIKKVIKEMFRITRRALILMEWHSFEPDHKDPKGLGIYHYGNWKRDYIALSKQFISEEQIHITKVTEDIWPDKNWKEVGAIIELEKIAPKKDPLVSVIIPAYNAEKYIKDSIDSILNQTYKNIEIIVIDDGSTDNTKKILKGYEDKIRYFFQVNKGPSSARNAGIGIAKGELIAYQDADDVSMRERIEKEVNYLLDNPTVAMVYSGHKIVFPNDRVITILPPSHDNFSLLQRNYIPCSSVMHRKSILDEVGLWNETIDWDLWIRISEKFEIGCIKECLYKYRKHDTSVSASRGLRGNRLIDLQMFRDRYRRRKERWIALKIKRISFECKLMRIFPFLNKIPGFWSGINFLANSVEAIFHTIEVRNEISYNGETQYGKKEVCR